MPRKWDSQINVLPLQQKSVRDMKRMTLSLISLLFATGLAMAQEGSTAVVSTKSGKVSGIIQEGTMAYLGIPYAKVERFMPPQPVKKWSGSS